MSRRLRVEEERARKIKEAEEEEVIDKFQIWQERVAAPLFWKRTHNGFRIEDLKEKHFNEVIEMIKEHYIPNEVLCKNTELNDDEQSLNCYIERLQGHLKNMTSIIAVDESIFVYFRSFTTSIVFAHYFPAIKPGQKLDNQDSMLSKASKVFYFDHQGFCSIYVLDYVEPEPQEEAEKKKKKKQKEEVKIKIAGVQIFRAIHRLDFNRVFSRVQLVNGDAMKTCVSFRSHINRKADVFAKFNCESFLRYYDLCILPEYRKKGLGYQMMLAGFSVARAMGVPVVMGLFNNFALQKLAKRMGMVSLYEVNYVEWRDKDGELIFDDPGAGNYNCALMAGEVPPPPPPEPPKPTESQIAAAAKKPKITRAERRVAAEKMKKI